MKRIFYILITLFIPCSTNYPQMQWEFMGLSGEEIYDIVIDDSSNVYVGSVGGVFKTTNNGTNWIFQNNGLEIARVVKLFIDYEGNIYLCGFASFAGYGLYKSSDGGENWIGIADTLNGNSENYFYDVVVIPNEPGGIIYVSNYYGVYRSTDNGITWQSTNYSDPCASYIGINTNGYMFFGNGCASWFGIYRSIDLGLTWIRHTFLSVNDAMVYLRDGTVLAGCYDPGLGSFGIYKTTNNGNTWFNTNTLNFPTADFVIDNNDDIYVALYGLVYLSTNNGTSWIDYELTGPPTTCIAIDSSGYVWAGAHQDGVYRTEGRTVPVELSSFSARVNGNEILLSWITASEINNMGFAIERTVIGHQSSVISEWERIGFVEGTGTTTELKYYSYVDENVSKGTYFYRLKQIDFDGSFEYSNILEVEVSIPSEFFLSQNYPNPFNPTTTIDYSIKNDGLVSLKIYDVLGNEIASLVDKNQIAGNYSVQFDASHLPSGIYIYKLISGQFSTSKKLILLK